MGTPPHATQVHCLVKTGGVTLDELYTSFSAHQSVISSSPKSRFDVVKKRTQLPASDAAIDMGSHRDAAGSAGVITCPKCSDPVNIVRSVSSQSFVAHSHISALSRTCASTTLAWCMVNYTCARSALPDSDEVNEPKCSTFAGRTQLPDCDAVALNGCFVLLCH